MGIWNIGNELKAIRDNKTYKEKGYSNFQEYAKSELEYSRSHCYRFIEVVENYSVPSMGQISNLGITKLLSLSALPQEERDDFIADTHEVNGEDKTVADMTTREKGRSRKGNDRAPREDDCKSLEEISNAFAERDI